MAPFVGTNGKCLASRLSDRPSRVTGIQILGYPLVFLLIQEKIGNSIPSLLLRLIHNLAFGIQALEKFSISLDSLSKPVISFEDTVIASTPTIFLFT